MGLYEIGCQENLSGIKQKPAKKPYENQLSKTKARIEARTSHGTNMATAGMLVFGGLLGTTALVYMWRH